MNFNDLQNAVIARQRQAGLNWGGAPTNTATSFNPPYEIGLYINQGYNDFLSKIMNYPIATLEVSFPTQSNVMSYPLNPLPPNGATVNPAALKVYEFIYTTHNSFDRYIPIISTTDFRQRTGDYQQRLGVYSAWPYFGSQLFGKRQLDIYPGTSSAIDTIKFTICPDPVASVGCTAAQGGILVSPTDVPLFPSQFHQALVHYAVAELADIADKPEQRDYAKSKYDEMVEAALEFGRFNGEGESEISVEDYWMM